MRYWRWGQELANGVMGSALIFFGIVGVVTMRVVTKGVTEVSAFMEWRELWVLCFAVNITGNWLVCRNASKFAKYRRGPGQRLL